MVSFSLMRRIAGFLCCIAGYLAASTASAAEVAVDVGHTLAATGAVSARGRKEFDFNRVLAGKVAGALAARVAHHLARDEVAGVVITHGTDTLEETAYFLQRVLAPAKPVVLTAAMRPATAPSADGPQNLLDAVRVAALPGACGVLACIAGTVHAGDQVRKIHPYRVDAFDSGDAASRM